MLCKLFSSQRYVWRRKENVNREYTLIIEKCLMSKIGFRCILLNYFAVGRIRRTCQINRFLKRSSRAQYNHLHAALKCLDSKSWGEAIAVSGRLRVFISICFYRRLRRQTTKKRHSNLQVPTEEMYSGLLRKKFPFAKWLRERGHDPEALRAEDFTSSSTEHATGKSSIVILLFHE